MSNTESTVAVEKKQCLACGEVKSLTEFSIHPSTNNWRHGRYQRCNACFASGRQIHESPKNTRAAYRTCCECPSFPMLDGVEFVHCEGYIGIAVDTNGDAWSCYAHGGWRLAEWRLCDARPNSRGYKRIMHRRKTLFVAQLVATAFHGPRPSGMEVCHGDGRRDNNAPNNLYWGTHSQNELDKQRHGTGSRGERNPSAKITKDVALRIKELRRQGFSRSQIKSVVPVTLYIIDRIIYGNSWTHI